MNSYTGRPYTRSKHGAIKLNNKNLAMYFGVDPTTITKYKREQEERFNKMFEEFQNAVFSERIK